jgi:hypothetical protein
MDNTFDKTALETIDLLEARLQRIELTLRGQVGETSMTVNTASAAQRLADLEHSLHQLASKSRVVQDLLTLRKFYRILYSKYKSDDASRLKIPRLIPVCRFQGRSHNTRYI